MSIDNFAGEAFLAMVVTGAVLTARATSTRSEQHRFGITCVGFGVFGVLVYLHHPHPHGWMVAIAFFGWAFTMLILMQRDFKRSDRELFKIFHHDTTFVWNLGDKPHDKSFRRSCARTTRHCYHPVPDTMIEWRCCLCGETTERQPEQRCTFCTAESLSSIESR